MVFGRTLKHPAFGRIVFNAYNVYALDIQRKQPPRMIFLVVKNGILRRQK
jgi:hypothetical protein